MPSAAAPVFHEKAHSAKKESSQGISAKSQYPA